MKRTSGGKYILLALLAAIGFCLEFVLVFILEPYIFGVSLNDYSTPQYLIHWTITCILWGIVGLCLILIARNKYQFDILRKSNNMIWWQWVIIIACIISSLIVSYINWDGFKVIKEYNNLGLLKFIFQYVYYLFETLLVTLILIFSQKAFEEWFHRTYIPYGGIILALTWGIGHFASKDILTAVLCLIVSLAYGSIYLLTNRDATKTYIFLSIMFIL